MSRLGAVVVVAVVAAVVVIVVVRATGGIDKRAVPVDTQAQNLAEKQTRAPEAVTDTRRSRAGSSTGSRGDAKGRAVEVTATPDAVVACRRGGRATDAKRFALRRFIASCGSGRVVLRPVAG
jgi:hypothetical protein